jgi:sodium-dependent dicarboxylate transporter 2/3/5
MLFLKTMKKNAFTPSLFINHKATIFLFLGVFISFLIIIVPFFNLPSETVKILAVAFLMLFWWITQALPMPIVALLPLFLFPLLGISSLEKTAFPYASPIVFLFLGGFLLGIAIEKWKLHRRIALFIILKTGTRGDHIILGFILSTGLISMWLSNTATTMMMFPIALSVNAVIHDYKRQKGKSSKFFDCTFTLHCLRL